MLAEYWQTMARADTTTTGPLAAKLNDLVALRFSGTDVENFLQGYLTRDLARFKQGETCLAALTNLKGRVVADGWCCASADGQIDWVVHASLAETIRVFMRPYLAFSRTELSTLSHDHLVVGLIESDGLPSARVVEDPGSIEVLSGVYPFGVEEEWNLSRFQARVALVSEATSGTFLPQMLGLVDAGAVDFDKGCYLGQEVVARAQHRGEVKRRLLLLSGDCTGLIPGASLSNDQGQTLGTVIENTSSACIAVVRQPAVDRYHAGAVVLTPAQS